MPAGSVEVHIQLSTIRWKLQDQKEPKHVSLHPTPSPFHVRTESRHRASPLVDKLAVSSLCEEYQQQSVSYSGQKLALDNMASCFERLGPSKRVKAAKEVTLWANVS